MLLDNLDRDLGYALKHEAKWEGGAGDAGNYAAVREAIAAKLTNLRDTPNRWGFVS
jgi:DNA polymerase epsilon subunit 1